MKRNKLPLITIILIFPFLLFSSCWKKQKHDITQPEIPQYVYSGYIIDYDSGEYLADVKMEIKSERQLYEVEFETQTVETDSLGFFSFPVIYPGTYKMKFQRGEYWINEQKLEIVHEDRSDTIKIPQIYLASEFPSVYSASTAQEEGPQYHVMSNKPAFCCAGTKAWINGFRQYNAWYGKYYSNIDNLKISNEKWTCESVITVNIGNENIMGFTAGAGSIYACVAPDTIYVISRWDGSVSSSTATGRQIRGITLNLTTGDILTCSRNTIYNHGTNPTEIKTSISFPFPNLRALACYRNVFSFDNSDHMLREHDAVSLEVIATYALLNQNSNRQIDELYDMAFDGKGVLWVTK